MSRDLETRLDRAMKAGDRADARKRKPRLQGTIVNRTGTDMAYVSILEGPTSGREKFGYYLGIAVRGEYGYHQLSPGFGPYTDQKAADEHAAELNRKLGHPDEKSAAILVAETMRVEPGRRTRRR